MNTWIVRISNNNKIAIRDWNNLVDESEQKRYVAWDKDSKNRIKKGDRIGFIIGEVGNETIYFYNVVGELSNNNRSSTWSDITYNLTYTPAHDISKREVIILDTNNITYSNFLDYKKAVGYPDNFTPRGTMRVARNNK